MHTWFGFVLFCFLLQVAVGELSSEAVYAGFILCISNCISYPFNFQCSLSLWLSRIGGHYWALSEESLLFKIPAAGIKELKPEEAPCRL